MAKELKQMLNRVTLQGTLMDNSLENKVDKKGRKYLSGVRWIRCNKGAFKTF